MQSGLLRDSDNPSKRYIYDGQTYYGSKILPELTQMVVTASCSLKNSLERAGLSETMIHCFYSEFQSAELYTTNSTDLSECEPALMM